MDKKIGRNEPCPCGSGKKYKQCCMGKPISLKTKHKVTVLNQKPKTAAPNLMDRAFGDAIEHTANEPKNLLASTAFSSTAQPPPGTVSQLGLPPEDKESTP